MIETGKIAERCRSCDKEIRWAITESGTRMPIDAEPVDNGNLVMTHIVNGGEVHVRYLKKGEEPAPLAPRYVSHFVTCPDRETWRKKKEERRKTKR